MRHRGSKGVGDPLIRMLLKTHACCALNFRRKLAQQDDVLGNIPLRTEIAAIFELLHLGSRVVSCVYSETIKRKKYT